LKTGLVTVTQVEGDAALISEVDEVVGGRAFSLGLSSG
jgi:hypothetical protein